MQIKIDRAIAKGRFITAACVALGIFVFPILMFLLSDVFIRLFSIELFTNGEAIGNLMSSYESYLNPSFDNWTSNPERGFRLFIGYLGAFLLNGLLVSLVVSWFQSRRERWEKGALHYGTGCLGKFSIIIGGNEMVPDLARQLLKDNRQLDYVLVMTNRDVPSLRKRFVSTLGSYEKKVVIYSGERTSKEDLKLLHIESAKELYVIGEQLDINQSGSHHDVKNMDCVQKIALLLKEVKSPKKTCRVMFEYQSTFSVFQFADVCDDISRHLDFRPFNYYETWAQKVLINRELTPTDASKYLPLEGNKPITADCEDTVHLIVVGMSRMGLAVAIEAAHLAHYPNFITKGKRSRITFIDSQARKEMHFFQGHYKELFALSRWRYMEAPVMDYCYEADRWYDDVMWLDPLHDVDSKSPYKSKKDYTLGEDVVDIDWQFIQGDLEMPSIQQYIKDVAKDEHSRLTIAICIPQDNASFAASLYLPDEVYESNNSTVVQVLAYQPYGDAMRKSFDDMKEKMKSYKLFAKLRAFGMMDSCYNLESQQQMEFASKAFKEYYDEARKKIEQEEKPKAETEIGKKGKTEKGKSLAAQQWSNLYLSSHMWTKLRSVEYKGEDTLNDKQIAELEKMEHARWNMEQLLLGFAPLKPEELKLILGEKDKERFETKKEGLKANMSHLDICSFERLKEIDCGAMKYDTTLVKGLPEIYKKLK